MKKIMFILLVVILVTGCGEISNTPTKQVEAFLNKYQTLDREVLDDLENVIYQEESFSDENRKKYREIIKKQYKNMSYKIKDEEVNADVAIVTTEISVLDFSKPLAEAREYQKSHPQEFLDLNGVYQESLYSNYVISKLEDVQEKVKYTLEIKLSKIDGKWKIDAIDDETEDKILGIYQY